MVKEFNVRKAVWMKMLFAALVMIFVLPIVAYFLFERLQFYVILVLLLGLAIYLVLAVVLPLRRSKIVCDDDQIWIDLAKDHQFRVKWSDLKGVTVQENGDHSFLVFVTSAEGIGVPCNHFDLKDIMEFLRAKLKDEVFEAEACQNVILGNASLNQTKG